MKVVITAGHGGADPGAVSPYGNNGSPEYVEAAFCADMRNYVAYYLRQNGITVETDGTGPANAPLKVAVALARSADIAVEFHLNAASNSAVSGIEVLSASKDKTLAQAIARTINAVTGGTLRGDNGWKPENAGQHKRLAFVQAGGLVVELDFITNRESMRKLYQQRWVVAKHIALSIINHINGDKQ